MKTFYLIKSFLPFAFLPIAPSVVQAELQREGILAPAGGALLSVVMQVIFTLGIIAWIARTVHRKNQTQAFLRMSSLSKKVYHQDRWISVEQYLALNHNIVVSHGLTPDEWEEWVRESEQYLGTEVPDVRRKLKQSIPPAQIAA